MTPVGFEPTQLALVELESTPLDPSGKVSMSKRRSKSHRRISILLIFACSEREGAPGLVAAPAVCQGAPPGAVGVLGQMGLGAGRPHPKSIPSVPAAHGREKD